MRPENGADSKFIGKIIKRPKIDRSFVVKVGSNLRRAVAPNNVQIHTSKKDPHKDGGGWRSFFTPIQGSRAG